ncbi:MAG: YgiT-type zinc finger protein [Anaerolineae bacterium]|nr:YgiT-type zinc finger protein [Anaerolineae bacterium]
MMYTCPSCNLGSLKPTHSTYVRWWNARLVTVPDFAAWCCDFCGYTRYDVAALAQINLLLGPDEETLAQSSFSYRRKAEGPGEQGPHRWSS